MRLLTDKKFLKRYVYEKDSYLKGFITILFTIKICKQATWRLSVCKWISTSFCMHTMEYSAVKMNELLMHVTTWMTLRHLILSQSEDIKQYCIAMVHFSKLQHKVTW